MLWKQAPVHYVDGIDTGPIILGKGSCIGRRYSDTLAARVLKTEHKILKEAVKIMVLRFQKKGDDIGRCIRIVSNNGVQQIYFWNGYHSHLGTKRRNVCLWREWF